MLSWLTGYYGSDCEQRHAPPMSLTDLTVKVWDLDRPVQVKYKETVGHLTNWVSNCQTNHKIVGQMTGCGGSEHHCHWYMSDYYYVNTPITPCVSLQYFNSFFLLDVITK